MAEKFRKIVTAPEQAAAKLRKLIEKKNPTEYVRRGRAKKNASQGQGQFAEIQDAAEIFGLNVAKWSAWLAAGGAQFLLTLARWMMLDNAVLRKMEKELGTINPTVKKTVKDSAGNKQTVYKNSAILKLMKKYPNASAHILWLFGLSAIGGGYVVADYVADRIDTVKEKTIDSEDYDIAAPGTYGEFLNKIRPITPFLIADLIAKEGVHVNDQGLHTPYLDSKNVPTIGFGSTLLKDGSRVTLDTPPITTDEAYELARWHLEEGETYFVLYCYDVAMRGVNMNTTSKALGLSSIVYNAYSKLIENPNDKNHQNRFDKLRKIYDEYGYATPDSLIEECFAKYPVSAPTSFGQEFLNGAESGALADKLGGFLAGGRGMAWRRWLEAGLITGDISPQMLMDCPVNGMYEFYTVMGQEKTAFFTGDAENRRVNRDTYAKFKQWLKNPVNADGQSLAGWDVVSDYLPKDILAECRNGECELGNTEFVRHIDGSQKRHDIAVKTYAIGYEQEYNNAIEKYKSGDYNSALSELSKMVKKYPKNALLYNDLAATCNKLGQYDNAIKYARKILHDIGDKSQYAAAQYNAGVAYEKQGKLDAALKNFELSVKNGNARVNKDVKRVREKIKNQKLASFDKAKSSIEKTGYVHDIGVYSVLNDKKTNA